MKWYVSKEKGITCGNGTFEEPFLTINEAAGRAVAGDEIIVAPVIYRESVNPANGGTSDYKRISYIAEKKGTAVISGAETAKNWKQYENDVWVFRVNNKIFGAKNPYTTKVNGDWYLSAKCFHTGEIYLNGKAMYEAQSLKEVLSPTISIKSWDQDFSLYNLSF
ncbi:MAG: hypothetical protein WCS15_10110 [Prevotella sp.]